MDAAPFSFVAFYLLSWSLLVGCGCRPPAAAPGAAPAAAPTSRSAATEVTGDEEFVLVVSLNKIVDGEERTDFVHMFGDPTPAVIAEKVKSLNWSNPQERPYIGLGRNVERGIDVLKLKGTLEDPNLDGLLRLYWIGGDTKYIHTAPLESADAAIPLLVSFRNKDGQWRTMVEWKDVPESDGEK